MGGLMAFRAGLRTGVLRWRTGHAKENVAGQSRDVCHSRGIRARAHRLPGFTVRRTAFDHLIKSRRPVPGNAHAVGDFFNPGNDRAARHSARLGDRQMRSLTKAARREETREHEHEEKFPFAGLSVETVHIAR